MAPRDKTACRTFPCKCKICISSIESDVYNKKKIQMFVVNMTFISSREVKKCIFHSCLRHSWNIHFFTSLDEIKVIFTTNIWISSIYCRSEFRSSSWKQILTTKALIRLPGFAGRDLDLHRLNIFHDMLYKSRNVRKRTFWHVQPIRLRSACASAQFDQSLRCLHEETLYP